MRCLSLFGASVLSLAMFSGFAFDTAPVLAQQGFITPCSYAPDCEDSSCASCGDLCGSTCRRSRFFGNVEYMYWQATRNATPYAGTMNRVSGTIGGVPISSSDSYNCNMNNTGYDRNSAFRLNFGYQISNRWDIGFRYTYFSTNGASSVGDPNVDSNLFLANKLDRSLADDILNHDFDDGVVDFASQRIGLDLNIYDLEIRRKLRLASSRFDIRLMGGFRFADIDQTSQIRYQSTDSGNMLSANVDETMGISAAGLRAGGEAYYFLGWRTSVFARGAVSLLFVNSDVYRQDLQLTDSDAGVRSISDSFQDVVPVLELNVGLRWQRGRFYVAGGYDIAHWFDMVQGLDAINQDDVDGATNSYRVERGNLSFDGFFVEAGLVF